ncbi:putative MFS family arabinose efflux permease [Frondihabitans sp. PhB188]|nr:putative MFS family arabinose efflux permease [Frondihabitans sp. PhB188]
MISVSLGSFVLVLSEFLPIGLLPNIASDLGIGIGTAGLLIVATAIAAAIGAPVITVVSSRIDRRYVLWSLMVLLIIADVVGAMAGSFALLLVARVLLGVTLGAFWAIGAGIAGRLVAAPQVIKATSIITAGVSVATVVSLPLGSLVANLASWRLAFVIGAGLAVVALVGQLILLPSIPSSSRVAFRTFGGLFRVQRARVGLIATAFVFLAQFTAYTFITPYLEDLVKVDTSTVTLALLVFGIAGIAGNFAFSVALSRNLVGTLLFGKILLAVAIVLLPLLAWTVPGVFVLLVVWGFVWGGMPLGMQTWMSTAAPGVAEGSLAMFVTTIQLAISGGSIVGAVTLGLGGYGATFTVSAVIAALGFVTLLVLGRSGSSRAASAPAAPVPVTTGAVAVPCP